MYFEGCIIEPRTVIEGTASVLLKKKDAMYLSFDIITFYLCHRLAV